MIARIRIPMRAATIVALMLTMVTLTAAVQPLSAEEDSRPDYESLSLRGRVVWLADAVQRRYDIKVMADARQRVLALEADDGRIYPIIEDLRGRSFRKDKRLREMDDIELFVRRYHDSPVVQVIRIYQHLDGTKALVDYWCDVCAIVMFENGPCDCCQDDNRLRQRVVENGAVTAREVPADS